MVLGTLIKSGGAGSVYRVRGDAAQVAKLYHAQVDRALYQRKVEAMLQLTPELPALDEGGKRYVQIAWPSALLRDARGGFVGYLMPAVDVQATSELECVLQEKQARLHGLPTGLGAKITLAANLAGVITELHRQHHRVVDLKPVNLRFYPRSLYMAMLDCDGFSIQGRGERFEAPQVTVDYLAPEFQLGGLSAAGEEAQDRFALAVVVFQLLNFGIHPFTGRPAHEHVPTDVPGRISARRYAYGRRAQPQLLPSPVSGHEAMPADLRQLFDRAFDGPGTARPSALEWSSSLRAYAQRASLRLARCMRDGEHQHFAGLSSAACARSALLLKVAKGNAQPAPAMKQPRAQGGPTRTGFGRQPPAPVLATARQRNLATTRIQGRRQIVNVMAQQQAVKAPALTPGQWLQNASFMDVFRLLVFLAVIGALGLGQFGEWLMGWDRDRDHAAQTQAESSAAASPAPSSSDTGIGLGYVAPIASDAVSSAPFGDGPDWRTIQRTRAAVVKVAEGNAADSRVLVDSAMSELDRALRTQSRADAATRLDDHRRFLEFLGRVLPASVEQRREDLIALGDHLRDNAYDTEAACEWSWLALLDGRVQLARNGFLRTIWTDPQYSCGWLGWGTIEEETPVSFGALVMAERLQLGTEGHLAARDLLVEAAMIPDGPQVRRWRVMDARARVRAAQLRGTEVPRDIRQRSEQMLPRTR